ncbi:MAG: ornithine carbamoyltransferase [Thermomicrobiales bacterium]
METTHGAFEEAGIANRTEFGPLGISGRLRGRSVLDDADLAPEEIAELLQTATRLKTLRRTGQAHTYLAGKTIGLLFQHPSTRTRTAFQVGMEQLGGQAIFLGVQDLQLKRGETIGDTARIMSRMVNAIAVRVANHDDLLDFAAGATVPVFNALTAKCHPIEPLGDLLALQERFGDVQGLKFTYLGDGNNVCHSLLMSCSAMGMSVAVAVPEAYQPDAAVVTRARRLAAASGATILITDDVTAAVADADAIYTDVHQSMGEADDTLKATRLAPYRVTKEVMAEAKPTAVFMHCLPMRRGEEVEADVADGPQSIIFDQAENRLHLHKALLLQTMW